MNADIESACGEGKVAAVIVNWRQPHRTIEAVHALAKQTVPPAVVVVVDNGSGDDSVNQLRVALPSALLVARETNGGFGTGCNAGIELAISFGVDYVWLINNDAMPEEHCLERMLARAKIDPEIGVIGACIHEPKNTVADHSGCIMNPFSFNCKYTFSETEITASKYAWITGASMLLTSRALKKIGLFDTGYFMYWEDADICCRMRRAGLKLAIAENAVVHHEAGTSSNDIRLSRFKWHLESQVRWVVCNYSHKFYGIIVVYARHLIKSIATRDFNRLSMTVASLRKITVQYLSR